jgi:hypothetical protein
MAVATATTHGMLSESEHSSQLRKAVIASAVGTAIEWYDFFLYGTAAGLIFGKLYFPNQDVLTATLLAFGTYFIGFAGRSAPPSSAITAIASAARRRSLPHCFAWDLQPSRSLLCRPSTRSASGAQSS